MGRHDGYRLVGGDPLRHVHVEAVGKVEPREHRITEGEREALLACRLDLYPVGIDADDARERRIEQSALLVVGGQADAVTFPKLQHLLLGKLKPVALLGRRQPLRVETDFAAAVGKLDLPVRMHLKDLVAPTPNADILGAAPSDLERTSKLSRWVQWPSASEPPNPSKLHRLCRLPDPCRDELVKLNLAAHRRTAGSAQKQARPLRFKGAVKDPLAEAPRGINVRAALAACGRRYAPDLAAEA